MGAPTPLKLYSSLAEWWPLLSPREHYAEEAAFFGELLARSGDQPASTLVEFGSGGGNNASYLKGRFRTTLVDCSPAMLEVSRRLNPECEHLAGDMRQVRLGREFDRVFIHDAICYMASVSDLRRAFETAFVHCRPGGAALFAPDCVRETFRPSTDHGGEDAGARGLRYLEWVWDPDPADCTYFRDMSYLLRSEDGSVRIEYDRHVEGLFSRAEWLELLASVGFEPHVQSRQESGMDCALDVFVGIKPRR